MSLSFDEVKRRFEERENLRSQGKIRFVDALYELQETHGVLPASIEEKHGVDLASFFHAEQDGTSAALPESAAKEPRERAGALLQGLIEWIQKAGSLRQISRIISIHPEVLAPVESKAPAVAERELPLGWIPALFVRPDGSAEEGRMDVLWRFTVTPEGVLTGVVRVPKNLCHAGDLVAVTLVATPAGAPMAEPIPILAGRPQSVRFVLPEDLRSAWKNISDVDLTRIPLRFVLYGAPPRESNLYGN